MKTRVIALILAVCMMLSLGVFASAHGPGGCTCETATPYYAHCGTNGTHVYCMVCGHIIARYGDCSCNF